MVTKADFTSDEWESIVQLPRWVAAAASAAQRDVAYRTNIEIEAGYVESAHAREGDSALLAAVADETLALYDNRAVATAIDFSDVEAGIATVLDRAGTVNALLAARADPTDAQAYRHWLLSITEIVISAARSGDFLGFGGQMVTESERRFRDRLATVLDA